MDTEEDDQEMTDLTNRKSLVRPSLSAPPAPPPGRPSGAPPPRPGAPPPSRPAGPPPPRPVGPPTTGRTSVTSQSNGQTPAVDDSTQDNDFKQSNSGKRPSQTSPHKGSYDSGDDNEDRAMPTNTNPLYASNRASINRANVQKNEEVYENQALDNDEDEEDNKESADNAARGFNSQGESMVEVPVTGLDEEADPTSKDNRSCPKGLSIASRSQCDIPSELLKKLLLPGETVLEDGQFDVYYVGNKYTWRWTLFLIICTGGFYLFVMFGYWLVNSCRRLLCSGCMSCQDAVSFQRGKLVVTSAGRFISWTLELYQSNHLDSRTHHQLRSITHVGNVEDVAQVTLHYTDRTLCCCCCRDYNVGIDVTFRSFIHTWMHPSNEPKSRYLHTDYVGSFLMNLGRYIVGSVDFNAYNSIKYGITNQSPYTIRIISNPLDTIYGEEQGLSPLEDLCKLNVRFMSLMNNRKHMDALDDSNPSYPDANSTTRGSVVSNKGMVKRASASAVRRSSAYGGNTIASHHHSESTGPLQREIGSPLCNKPVFLSAREAADLELQATYHDVVLTGVKEFYSDRQGFTLIDPVDGKVTIPETWLPLTPGEEIVSAVGQYLKPDCSDILRSIFSFGIYYCRYLRKRSNERSAIILTTHRIVEIILFNKQGRVSAELGNMEIYVRSYFPRNVTSGYIRSNGTTLLQSAIACPYGELVITLPSTQLSFAQKMQLVTSRQDPLPIKNMDELLPNLTHLRQDVMNGSRSHPVDQRFTDLSSMSSEVRATVLTKQQELSVVLEKSKLDDDRWSELDMVLLPLFPQEKLLHRFHGGPFYRPCCLLSSTMYGCNFTNENANEPKCFSFITCIKMLTCAFRPLVTTPHCVITDRTVFYVDSSEYSSNAKSHEKNSTNIGKEVGTCSKEYRLDPFMISWVPIRKIRDYELGIRSSGASPNSKFLCCETKPYSKWSRYEMKINTSEGMMFKYQEDIPLKSWARDPRLTKMQNVLGAVQTVIVKESYGLP